MAALGAGLLHRHVPGHEVAPLGLVLVGVVLAAVVGVSPLGGLFEDLAAALGALAGHLDDDGLGVVALRPAGAGQEAAEPAGLIHQIAPALGADHVGHLVGHLDALAVQIRLGLLELLLKVAVEVAQQAFPVHLAGLHLVQPLLHGGGEGGIHDVGEFVLHQAGDHLPQGSGAEVPALLHHVLPVQDGGDGGGVGGGAADALLLQGLDQRGLGVAAGGLGEVLVGLEGLQLQGLPLLQIGQGGLERLLLLVLPLHVHGGVAGELEGRVGGPEGVSRGGHLDGHAVVHGGGHLAGQEAAPDELVELILLGGEGLLDVLRGQVHVGGPDGLVGVLGAGFGLVDPGLAGVVVRAVAGEDEVLRGGGGLVGQAEGVGTHIGDETHGALPLDVHALIELLGDGHGPPGRHVELAAGLLLEGGGDEGGRGVALLVLPLDAGDGEGGVLHRLHDGVDLRLAVQLHLLLPAVEAGLELPQVGGDAGEISVQGPVLLGDEGLDVGLPLAHQPGGHRLHPPGGQAPADLLPQQGGDLIAHDAVQHPARLLGVHQIHIDGPGVGDGVVDHLLGDLVEGHPVGLVVRDAQHLLQVPGDGLALPVGVGGEEHFLTLLGGFFQLVNDLFLALDGLVVQFKAVLHVHAQLALGQVAHMAHGGLHLIARAQIFADGLGLRRRLDDHQIRFCHSIVLLTYLVVKADGSGKPLAGKLIQIALSLQQGQGSVHPPGGNLGAAHDLVGHQGAAAQQGEDGPLFVPHGLQLTPGAQREGIPLRRTGHRLRRRLGRRLQPRLRPLPGQRRGLPHLMGKACHIFHQNILGRADQLGLAPGDQAVGARAHGRVRRAGDGEYLPVLVQGQPGGDQRAAVLGGLHRRHARGQAAEDAVADGEAPPLRRGAGRVFRQDGPRGGHVLVESLVAPGVDHVHPAGQHRHRRAAALEGPLEGGRVDALGQAGEHQRPRPGQLQAQPPRHGHAVGGTLPGPHDGDGQLLVKAEEPPLHIEHQGKVVELEQTLRVGRVLVGQQGDAQPVAVAQDALRPLQGLVRQGAAKPFTQRKQFVLPGVGEVGRLCGAEPAHQRRGRLGPEALPGGEPQQIG